MFITVKQAAEKWGISDRRIRVLCADGKIPRAHREGRAWKIPADAAKPEDGRRRSRENILLQIDRKKKELDRCRPLMKDHMEAVGHKEAFDFVSQLVKDKVPMSESVKKQIHYLVLADKNQDRGVYRRVPVCIMGAQHEPVQPYMIVPKMEQLLQWYGESSEHIITKLARFHIEFEGIHPFIDGNGRVGRLIALKECLRHDDVRHPVVILTRDEFLSDPFHFGGGTDDDWWSAKTS